MLLSKHWISEKKKKMLKLKIWLNGTNLCEMNTLKRLYEDNDACKKIQTNTAINNRLFSLITSTSENIVHSSNSN